MRSGKPVTVTQFAKISGLEHFVTDSNYYPISVGSPANGGRFKIWWTKRRALAGPSPEGRPPARGGQCRLIASRHDAAFRRALDQEKVSGPARRRSDCDTRHQSGARFQ